MSKSPILKTAKNFLSLTFLSAVNYLIPIIILPYVVRTVGIENYGLVSYIFAFLIPVRILVDFGFNLSGVKEIALNKHNKEEASEILSKIVTSKILLLTICAVVVTICGLFFIKTQANYWILFFSFFVVVGQAMLPIWFYQGVEETNILFLFSLISRAIYLCLIFFLVTSINDFIYINACLAIADLFLCIFCYVHICFRYKLFIRFTSFKLCKKELQNNLPFAQTNIYMMLCANIPFIILGFFANNLTLGYYAIADRVMQIIRTSVMILYNSIFPRILNLHIVSTRLFFIFIKKLTTSIVIIYSLSALLCYFFPNFLIRFLLNNKTFYPETYYILKILSLMPLFAALEIIPSHLLLLNKKQKQYAKILLLACFFCLSTSYILINIFSYKGAAMSYLLTEFFILISLLFVSKKELLILFLAKLSKVKKGKIATIQNSRCEK